MYAKKVDTFFHLFHIIYQYKKSWSKERRGSMSERIYNKLLLYANILQKIGVINEKEKNEILHTIGKKAL
ncbi:6-pyruvoyl tetrahydropterin synthase [Bacillus thuringiensis serovar thailandensis]|nr:6-pyruvoyl tetrahydropterin synthase [Bacillus thuringiensis serovar thailandensis]